MDEQNRRNMKTIKELRQRLRKAIHPVHCRFATEDDRINALLEVQKILDELKTIKELKD